MRYSEVEGRWAFTIPLEVDAFLITFYYKVRHNLFRFLEPHSPEYADRKVDRRKFNMGQVASPHLVGPKRHCLTTHTAYRKGLGLHNQL